MYVCTKGIGMEGKEEERKRKEGRKKDYEKGVEKVLRKKLEKETGKRKWKWDGNGIGNGNKKNLKGTYIHLSIYMYQSILVSIYLQVSINLRYQSILVRLYDWYDCPTRSHCPTIYLVRLLYTTIRLSISINESE